MQISPEAAPSVRQPPAVARAQPPAHAAVAAPAAAAGAGSFSLFSGFSPLNSQPGGAAAAANGGGGGAAGGPPAPGSSNGGSAAPLPAFVPATLLLEAVHAPARSPEVLQPSPAPVPWAGAAGAAAPNPYAAASAAAQRSEQQSFPAFLLPAAQPSARLLAHAAAAAGADTSAVPMDADGGEWAEEDENEDLGWGPVLAEAALASASLAHDPPPPFLAAAGGVGVGAQPDGGLPFPGLLLGGGGGGHGAPGGSAGLGGVRGPPPPGELC